jgi:hypothetical protein
MNVRSLIALVACIGVSLWLAEQAHARGGFGGGRGGGGGGGGFSRGGGGFGGGGGFSGGGFGGASLGRSPSLSGMGGGGFGGDRGFGGGAAGLGDRGLGDRGLGDLGGDRGFGDRGLGELGGDRGFGEGGLGDRGFGDRGFGEGGLGDRGFGEGGIGDRGLGDRGIGDRGIGERDFARPTNQDLGRFLNLPEAPRGNLRGVDDRLPAAGRPAIADRAHQFGEHRAINGLPDKAQHDQWRDHRDEWANGIRDNVGHRWDNMFTRDWWHDHHGNWDHHQWWWNHGGWDGHYWWGWATWPALTGWFAGSWGEPIYYDYGGNVVYNDNSVYVNDQDVGTPEQFAQQAIDTAAAGAQALPGDAASDATGDNTAEDPANWMPLGVFAVTKQGTDKPTIFLQLAVNKQGIIAGTYENTGTDQSLPITGSVDKQTQRACWTVGKYKDTVMETGIYNLTQDETQVLVHFGTQKTQTWSMVRMNQPQDNAAQGADGAASDPADGQGSEAADGGEAADETANPLDE